jgi:hypothetical protein
MPFGEQSERKECLDEAASAVASRKEECRDQAGGEGGLEGDVGCMPWPQRGERAVDGDDDWVVVHSGRCLLDEVEQVDTDRDCEESSHG